MFNRQPFNRGKFNRKRTDRSVYFFGNASLTIGTAGHISTISTLQGEVGVRLTAAGQLNHSAGLSGSASVEFDASGFLIRSLPYGGYAAIRLSAAGQVLRIRIIEGGAASVIFTVVSGGFNTYRYEHLKLPDLTVRVGDELIINTDLMTVTLNGQNAIPYLSRDSEFYLFNPNENDVIYTSGNPNDRVDIRILWKDQYI